MHSFEFSVHHKVLFSSMWDKYFFALQGWLLNNIVVVLQIYHGGIIQAELHIFSFSFRKSPK